MSEPAHIAEAVLAAPAHAMAALERFYGGDLGLATRRNGRRLEIAVGDARLAFEANDDEPFYHFAFLVPGDGFDVAHAWLATKTRILPREGTTETVFDFSFWDALACYCHDPAGNIVELIAHRDIPGTGRDLLAISEVGIVTPDPHATAARIRDELGLELWSGDLDGLAFVGRKAHTLILSRPGRGWLPTGRPAEEHPVAIALSDGRRFRTAPPGATGPERDPGR